MLSKLYSVGSSGIDSFVVTIECCTQDRLPKFELLGLTASASSDIKKRIRYACESSGYLFPPLDIMINLSPVDIKKDGAVFELAILCAIFQSDRIIPMNCDFSKKCIIGELSVFGTVQSVSDITARVMVAKKAGMKEVYLPETNVNEASCVDGISIFGVKDIRQIIDHFRGVQLIEPIQQNSYSSDIKLHKDFNEIDSMNGRDFEFFVGNLFRSLGYYNVKVTPTSHDFGADIIAERDGVRFAIQCKRYSSPVGVSAIQEVMASKSLHDCHVACVLTNSTFTPSAEELARKNLVILWDGNKLKDFLSKVN